MSGDPMEWQCNDFADLGEIARAKFDFDVVGHYSRPEVLSLVVQDKPANPVTFTSSSSLSETYHRCLRLQKVVRSDCLSLWAALKFQWNFSFFTGKEKNKGAS
ncbi:hypothetical protein SAY86_019775 [Trapa natans]|uniref:Uncharacterized protein n=1 Tax=Trapa natans TaxID=22666 RepID=A0AAN7LLH8_TRANT|nr:hypothetical protein SAY86_019775 [Trapa natans]